MAHCRNTIIKLHGDYLDLRLKNTPEELAAYEAPIDQLLDRILDEFGLIVSGWSAQYDTALCNAIARMQNRRFPMYWSVRGGLTDAAQRLVNCRAARVLRVSNADQFFSELQQRVDALSRFEASDPISAQVAVARAKRYLSKPEFRIEFRDLLSSEVEKIVKFLSHEDLSDLGNHFTSEVVGNQMSLCEQQCTILLSILAVGAYWGSEEHNPEIVRSVKRLIDVQLPQGSVSCYSDTDLRRYPALLAIYVIGIVSVARRDFALLRRLFSEPVTLESHAPLQHLVVAFHQHKVIWRNHQKLIPTQGSVQTPLSNHLCDKLRPLLKDLISSDAEYEDCFDWFEYLYGLQHCHLKQDWKAFVEDRQPGKEQSLDGWGPIGCFGWRRSGTRQWIVKQTETGSLPEHLGGVIRCLFGDTSEALERFRLSISAFNRSVEDVVWKWR